MTTVSSSSPEPLCEDRTHRRGRLLHFVSFIIKCSQRPWLISLNQNCCCWMLETSQSSLQMQSKYGCTKKESRFISEVTLERMSGLFGSFSMLPSIGETKGTLFRQSSSTADLVSRGAEGPNNPRALKRNASSVSDMSSMLLFQELGRSLLAA